MITIKRWKWSILAFSAVLILCVIPVPEVPQVEDVPLFDKWVHFVMYGGIACAVWVDIWQNAESKKIKRKYFLYAVVLPILFGLFTEFVQAYLTTYRSGDWFDALADSIGVLLSIPIGLFLLRRLCPIGNKDDA